MFCKHCGNQIPDNATFCTHCGNSTQTTPPTTPYHQPQQSSSFYVVSLVLGIVGIVLALFSPILGLIPSIVGIVLGAKERKASGKAVGLTLSIIGASIAVLNWLLAIILLNSLFSLF